MRLRDDDRAQSIQIGAVLLFAVLIIAFSSYQAFVVPEQNREVEFNHNQQVQGEMQELRNQIVSIHGETATRSVTLTLGTRYPARLVAVNPGPPSGTIRTSETADSGANLTIENATARGETGDFWNGSSQQYDTGFVVYQPNYNVYGQAPETVYENTVLSNRFEDASLAATDQTLIDGKRISVVTINGSLSRTQTGSTSLDLEPVSTSTTTVAVSNESANVTLSMATQLPESEWDALLADQRGEEGGHVLDYGVQTISDARFDRLWITLEPNVSYQLRMTKIGIGSQVTPEGEAYLTDIAGNATRLDTGDTTEVTVELRDAYNNPVTDGQINASSENGSLSPGRAEPDEDGQVTFTYDSTGVASGQWVDLNFSAATDVEGSFDGTTPRNVTMQVYVRDAAEGNSSANGAYSVAWTNPDDASANDGDALSSCSADTCTWDVGASDDGILELNATLSPPYDGVALEFAVSNSTVATVSPGSATTGPSGSAITDLGASENGSLNVLASGNDGSDTIEISIKNLTSGSGGGQIVAYPSEYHDGNSGNAAIPPTSPIGTITAFTRLQSDNGNRATFSESATTGSGSNPKYRHETGLRIDNISSGSHDIVIEYQMGTGSNSEEYALRVVDENGDEIDGATDYTLTPSGQLTTASFDLSQDESDYIDTNGQVYLVVSDPGDDDTNDELFVDYVRVEVS
jgi:hypothetical protein